MKILHFFPSTRLTEGGTVRAAIDFCSVLARRGHEVTWLTCDDTDVPEDWRTTSSTTPKIAHLGDFEKSGKRISASQVKQAKKIIAAVDVVHIHAMWLTANPQIVKACDQLGIPWVISIHGMLDDWCMNQRGIKKQLYLATAGRRLNRNATTFLCTAEEEKRQASKWLKHSNIAVIPYIVDLSPYDQVPTPQEAIEMYGETEEPTVLFLSRIHEKKSIETLIDAAAILKKRNFPIRILIAGTGESSYEDTLKRRAEKAGVSGEIQFLGMVVGSLKLSLYAMADLFALPTQQENFGLVYPEAMLCQTATVGTKGTDIWRELEEGGAIIEERTPKAFANVIENISQDKEQLVEMGKAGRAHILKWLDTDTVASKYEEMYQNATNER